MEGREGEQERARPSPLSHLAGAPTSLSHESAQRARPARGRLLTAQDPYLPHYTYLLTSHPRTQSQAFALLTMALLFGWVWCGPWLTLASAVFALHGHPTASLLLAAIAAAWIAPIRLDGTAAWPAFRAARVWDCWRRYFALVIATPSPPPKEGAEQATSPPSLIVHFPHGTFPVGSFLAPVGLVDGGLLPPTTVGAIASVLFHLPVLRHVYAWMGCIPADRGSIEAALRSGRSVGLVPEGVAGIFSGATTEREVILTAHKGFVKLALRGNGGTNALPTPITPCFVFGQSRVLSFKGSPRLSRAIRASVGIWWGRWGLPCVPRRVDLVIAVGRPVVLPPPSVPGQPSQAEIDAGFAAVLAELTRAYEAVRPGVRGYEHTRLVAK